MSTCVVSPSYPIPHAGLNTTPPHIRASNLSSHMGHLSLHDGLDLEVNDVKNFVALYSQKDLPQKYQDDIVLSNLVQSWLKENQKDIEIQLDIMGQYFPPNALDERIRLSHDIVTHLSKEYNLKIAVGLILMSGSAHYDVIEKSTMFVD